MGRRLSGRPVSISLDPLLVEWVYAGPDGTCDRRQKAEKLTAERVRGLDVSHHRVRGR